ncbi:MAG: hypothetical protein GXO29_05130 [Thermotogae bacterium]|nr:hypothetical protein [Thermotogota bacterium]
MLVLALLVSADTGVKEVIAEGVASYEEGRKDVARDRAVKDALRKAVEQAVGTFISSETVVENYEVLKDRILSKSEGYVSEYRILREKEEDGLYRVLVRAKVKTGELKRDLQAMGILIQSRGRPRIMVLVDDEDVRSMIEEALLREGFPVVDYETTLRNTEKDSIKAALSGDDKLARLLAIRNGAEIYIAGDAKVKEGNYRGKRIYSVILRLKAVEAATGELLSSVFIHRKLPFDEMEAKRSAVEEAVDRLTDGILSRWRRGEVIVHLKVKDIPPSEVPNLREAIYRNVRGVRGIYERENHDGYLILEISTDTSPQEVLDDLRRIKTLRITGYEGQSVEARYVK